MSLPEWLGHHLPAWLSPVSPWGRRDRAEMPEMHQTINRQQAASLRIDRHTQRVEAQAALERWREGQDD